MAVAVLALAGIGRRAPAGWRFFSTEGLRTPVLLLH
jgi:hypothetical protein